MGNTLFVTIPEAAHLLRVGPQTIRNHLFRGDFPIPSQIFCGRRLFRRADIEAFVRGDKLPVTLIDAPPFDVPPSPEKKKRGRPRKQPTKQKGGDV